MELGPDVVADLLGIEFLERFGVGWIRHGRLQQRVTLVVIGAGADEEIFGLDRVVLEVLQQASKVLLSVECAVFVVVSVLLLVVIEGLAFYFRSGSEPFVEELSSVFDKLHGDGQLGFVRFVSPSSSNFLCSFSIFSPMRPR